MTKRATLTVVLLAVGAAAGLLFWQQARQRGGTGVGYASRFQDFPVTFRYPSGWRLREEEGRMEVFRQIRLLGPRNADDTYTCSIAVWGSPLKAYGGRHGSVDGLVRHYTTHLFNGSRVVAEGRRRVGGVSATDLTVSYTIPPLHQPGLKAIAIPVMTRTVFLERNPYLYELSYSADARESDRSQQAFDLVLATFRFQ